MLFRQEELLNKIIPADFRTEDCEESLSEYTYFLQKII